MTDNDYLAVVIGSDAPELERFAADELCGYLEKLFGIQTRPTTGAAVADVLLLVGSPTTNPAIQQIASSSNSFPELSDSCFVLRCVQPDAEHAERTAVLIAGGSPQATLWAVYELVERWGVCYLLHGDLLPEPRDFEVPDLDVVMEPELTIRQWRVINDFACGPESWGMADYRPVLDQLAKLKFNRILISIWPWQPFLHYEAGGIERQSAALWFNFHYPITDDMVGRHLFGDADEFWNPDLPLNASYAELTEAGIELVRNLIAYARERGMA